MQLTTEAHGHVTLVRVQERRLTSALAPELKTELLRVIGENGPHLLLDVRDVTYTDSSALSALLFGKRQAEGAGGTLKMIAGEGHLLKMMAIAQLDRVVEVFATEDAALASF